MGASCLLRCFVDLAKLRLLAVIAAAAAARIVLVSYAECKQRDLLQHGLLRSCFV